MQAVTGVFVSETKAQKAFKKLQASGLSPDRITVLTPGEDGQAKTEKLAIDTTEQPGVGTGIGAVLGGVAGASAAVVAFLPGVGAVTALGLLGAAVLTAAGATLGAMAGRTVDNASTSGLPEDEIFVYEDALRKGRSVIIALADDEAAAEPVREQLKSEGAEAVDAAREEWWIGLRSAEEEHYRKAGRNLSDEEDFYRLGFEAALHARHRCQEFDQVSAEMESSLEDLEQKHPGVDVAQPFTRGYIRGREYYQRLCNGSKAA